MTVTIETMVERWSDPMARPLFKGRLIDDDGCCCAQGDVLRLCGWSDDRLRRADQYEADCEVAKALNVSVTHAVLLRHINDKDDGCPQDVLAHPERILGDQAPRVLAFWRLIDGFTPEQWNAARDAARDAAWDAARDAAWDAARDAAWDVAWNAAWDVAWNAAWDAAGATNEIQGAERLPRFFFLPIFGINHPDELTP